MLDLSTTRLLAILKIQVNYHVKFFFFLARNSQSVSQRRADPGTDVWLGATGAVCVWLGKVSFELVIWYEKI